MGLFASVSIYGADTRGPMREVAGKVRKDNECTPVGGAPATVFISSNFFDGCINTNLMILHYWFLSIFVIAVNGTLAGKLSFISNLFVI